MSSDDPRKSSSNRKEIMTLKIKRTGASDYGQVTKVLIAGNPGAGKTLVSSTWPSPFYASAEGGLMSIADRDIPYSEVRSISDLLKIKTALDQPAHLIENLFGFPIETVVVDTIDEIQRILIRERLEETKRDALALGDWGYIAEQMAAIVRGFRNLNLHVVFTCHLKEVTDNDTGRVSYKPQMQGGFTDQIAAQVDLALLLKSTTRTEIVDGKAEKITRRVLQTNPDLQYEWIKDRSGKLPTELEIDFQTDYERISTLIFGGTKLKEGKTSEIEVELPELQPIKPANEAVVRPMRRARPSVPSLSTAAPSPAPAPAEQVVAPEPVVTAPVEEVKAPEIVQENATVPEPVAEEVRPDGILVRNPDQYMPAKSLKLTPCGHGTDLYCQTCGKEIETVRRSELSMVRFRSFLCEGCFQDKKR